MFKYNTMETQRSLKFAERERKNMPNKEKRLDQIMKSMKSNYIKCKQDSSTRR